MLRPAGGFQGGGGSRPPVNIEVNFLAGDNNAFKQAREDVKALKADLDGLARHQFFNGGGSGGGFAPGGGGGGGIPTAPGTMPTTAPVLRKRNEPFVQPSGQYGPWPAAGSSGTAMSAHLAAYEKDLEQLRRINAKVGVAGSVAASAGSGTAMSAHLAAYEKDLEQLRKINASIPKNHPFMQPSGQYGPHPFVGPPLPPFGPPRPTQSEQYWMDNPWGTRSLSPPPPPPSYIGLSSRALNTNRPIDRLQANINRRRQGLPDLPDPTIAAAAANAAATAPVRGAAGGFLASGMALPAAVLAGIAGGIGANTPQGIQAIGGIGGFLEGATRREGFASQYFESARTILRPVFNLDGYGNPISGFRNLALGPFADQARTGERLNRMLAGQSAGNMGYQLGQMTSLSSTGVGLSAIEQAKAQNALRTSQLEDQVFNRASLGPDQRLSAIEELKSTYQAGLDIKRQELAASQGVLDAKLREKEAAEQMAAAQFNSLAQMGRGDLKRLERDFNSIQGGSRDLTKANRLAANGIVTPEVSQIQEAYVKDIAPNVSAFVSKARDDLRKAAAEQQQKVDELIKEIGTAGDGLTKAFTGLTGKMVEKFNQLEAIAKETIDQITVNKKNENVKSRQGVRAPGVAG